MPLAAIITTTTAKRPRGRLRRGSLQLAIDEAPLVTDDASALEPRMGFAARSDDVSGSWTTFDIELRGGLTVLLGAVDPNDARCVLAYRRYTDELSEDGGESWDDVASVSGDLSAVAFAPDGSRVWYGGEDKGLHVSMDGGRTFEPQSLDLTIRCLAVREGEPRGCADNFADGFAVGVSFDGGDSFEPRFRYREILGQIECAEGTRSAEVCPIAWRAIADLFGIDAGAAPAADAGTGTETREEAGPPPLDAGGSGGDGRASDPTTTRADADVASAATVPTNRGGSSPSALRWRQVFGCGGANADAKGGSDQ